MDMQVVVYFLLDEITHILINAHTIGGHLRRTKLDLRLTLKGGLLHIKGDGCHDTCADVAWLVFAKVFFNGLGNMLL